MLIGHYAVALAAKKTVPRVSLGTLFLSAQLVDLLWPLFMLVGLESARIDPGNTVVVPMDFNNYPYTHSLLGAILWSCAMGLLDHGLRREVKTASIVGALVFSHWILDLITHRPDLPLGFSGNTYFGLGLWNSMVGTLVVEIGIFVAGIILYVRSTTAKDRIGSIGFWSLVGVLGVIYFANTFGPPTPSLSAIAIAGNASWLFVFWAYWIDKHRSAKAA